MHKHFILVFLLLGSVTACKEVTFKEPQPKGKRALRQIPRALHGSYLDFTAQKGQAPDTLVITSWGFKVVPSSKTDCVEVWPLSDSLILKYYKGYYFINSKQANFSWRLIVVRADENQNLTHLALDKGDESFNEFLYSLSRELRIDSTKVNDETYYQIDPTPRKLVDLIKKGYFKKYSWRKVK